MFSPFLLHNQDRDWQLNGEGDLFFVDWMIIDNYKTELLNG
jgi:hypothetical protein